MSRPTEVLAQLVPADSVPLDGLGGTVRRRLARGIMSGKLRTGQHLLDHVEGPDRAVLLSALKGRAEASELAQLPTSIDDLLHESAVDLIASVGRTAPPKASPWTTVLNALIPSRTPAETAIREATLEALRERAARREAGRKAEVERAKSAKAPVPAPMAALRDGLVADRVALRRAVVPEGEHAVPADVRFDEDDQAIVVTADTRDRPTLVHIGRPEAEPVTVWIFLPEPGEPLYWEASHHDTRWVLGAVDRVLDLIADPTSPAHQALLALLSRPTWQTDLDRVDHALAFAEEADTLGWRVVVNPGSSSTFRPVRCQTGRGGKLTCKNLAWRDLSPSMLADRADQRVYELLSRGGSHPGAALAAAEALIGHPRVFGPGTDGPVAVRRPMIALALQQGRRVRLGLEADGEPVELADLCDARHGTSHVRYVHRADGPSLVQVVTLPWATLDVVARWVASRPMPEEGVPALLSRLPKLAKLLPVRVDPALRGGVLEADARPLLRLTWDGASLRIAARLRPLPELPAVVPGEGLAELVTHRGAGAAHVVRDLDAEPARVAEALAPLALPAAARAGWDWVLHDRDQMLDALLAIGATEGTLQLEWEGELPSVAQLDGAQVRIDVASGRDWLGLSGTAQTEAGEVSLADLLRAARDGRSWMEVRPGTFLRVADRLKGALGSVAAAEDRGRVRPIHAAALAELGEAGAAVAGSEAFQASVERIRTAPSLPVEVPADLQATLRDYQVEGFRWLARMASWAPGAVLADDMGLRQDGAVDSAAAARAALGPTLVVCPLSVAPGWEASSRAS
ncbi:MAG: hypothetical protein R3F59_11720 [Myxococcota bacterium]